MNGSEHSPRKKYERPPIQEAICEIWFTTPSPLSKNEIERIQPVWSSEYPLQQMVAENSLEVHLTVDKVNTKSTPKGHKLITRSTDGKDMAQLGATFLAVNRLDPYPGWEESFRDTILARLNEVQRVYGLTEVNRVGLRYINRIDIPEKNLRLSEWFVVTLPVPSELGDRGGNFQFHLEQRLADGINVIINFLSLPSAPDSNIGTSVILDLDVIWLKKVNIDAISAVLEQVHGPHHRLFEGYLLDKTRDLFHCKP